VKLVLDCGALIALERNDRAMWRRLTAAHRAGEVRPLDDALGRAAGELLGRCRRCDVVDAALVLLAGDGDEIVTSGLDDLEPLALAAGCHVELIRA
jgi:hypothetical protein